MQNASNSPKNSAAGEPVSWSTVGIIVGVVLVAVGQVLDVYEFSEPGTKEAAIQSITSDISWWVGMALAIASGIKKSGEPAKRG